MRMVRSCCAGVLRVTASFAFASNASIFALSCETSDLRYSSSSEPAMAGAGGCLEGRARATGGLEPEEVEESVKLDRQRVGLPVPRYGPSGRWRMLRGPSGTSAFCAWGLILSGCSTLGSLLLDAGSRACHHRPALFMSCHQHSGWHVGMEVNMR